MPRKSGKNSRKTHSRKNNTTKNTNNKPNKKQQPHHKNKQKQPSTDEQSHKGRVFSKQIFTILQNLTQLLREVDNIPVQSLYAYCTKMDEMCINVMYLQNQSSTPTNINIKMNKKSQNRILNNAWNNIWGYESNVNNNDEEISLNLFSLWLKEQNTKYEINCGIDERFKFQCNLAEGRGVIALLDMKKGFHCMSIHRKLMITHTYILNESDEQIRRFIRNDAMCKKYPTFAMIAFVWYERMKGSKSYWKPYFDALPQKYQLPHQSNIIDLIPFLTDTLILDKIMQLKIIHLRNFIYLKNMITQTNIKPGLRFIDYYWASAVVMTRQNRIPIVSQNIGNEMKIECKNNSNFQQLTKSETEVVLIPGWDFCNYKCLNEFAEVTSFYNPRTACNEMNLIADVSVGDQIYMYYGHQRNEELYLNSGFVIDGNVNDELELTLHLDMDVKHDKLCNIKLKQIQNAKLSNPIKALIPIPSAIKSDDKNVNTSLVVTNDVSTEWIFSVLDDYGITLPLAILQFARIANMNESELKIFMKQFYAKQMKMKIDGSSDSLEIGSIVQPPVIEEVREMISVENEIFSWNMIINDVKSMIYFFDRKLNECKNEYCIGVNTNNVNESEILKSKSGHIWAAYQLLNIERGHYYLLYERLKAATNIIKEKLKSLC